MHVTGSRPAHPDFQAELDALTDATIATVAALGWEWELAACADVPVTEALSAAQRADAVVILGGEDVDPVFYGGALDYPEQDVHHPQADEAQIAVVRAALADRRPLLGICRGMQVLGVALGGTLVQHLPTSSAHRGAAVGIGTAFVTTRPTPTDGYGLPETRLPVLCSHHQALDRPGDGLVAVAHGSDGVIEAVVHAQAPLTGVQWHPEHPDAAADQLTPLLRRLERQCAENVASNAIVNNS
jgi:putative glutamine amidotransferase